MQVIERRKNQCTELAARCAVLVGDFYARRGWTWGGVGNDPGYTPEAESIAECIQHLLDHEFLQPGGTISTGRLMVANGEGKSRTVYLELGWADEHGHVCVGDRPGD